VDDDVFFFNNVIDLVLDVINVHLDFNVELHVDVNVELHVDVNIDLFVDLQFVLDFLIVDDYGIMEW
jgi:hypothetical protein